MLENKNIIETMLKKQCLLLLFCMVCCFSVNSANLELSFDKNENTPDTVKTIIGILGKEIKRDSPFKEVVEIDEAKEDFCQGFVTINEDRTEYTRESIFPHKSLSLMFSHFTWGAELGCSIDMTGQDQSTIDLDVNLGYKNIVIRNIGVGAGIHRSVNGANTFIPVYFLFRSSFREKPSLCFLHFKAGYSFNTIEKSPYLGDVTASLGVGINLAMSKKFKSHIILSYAFRHFSLRHRDILNLDKKNISLAQISFGVNF